MKKLKKLCALLLSVCLVFSMETTTFAAQSEPITVDDGEKVTLAATSVTIEKTDTLSPAYIYLYADKNIAIGSFDIFVRLQGGADTNSIDSELSLGDAVSCLQNGDLLEGPNKVSFAEDYDTYGTYDVEVVDGYQLFKIPVTIETEASGTYTVNFEVDWFAEAASGDEYDLTAKTFSSTITITEPKAPYELYYTLNSEDGSDTDNFKEYDIEEETEVVAEFFIVSNEANVTLQAYDIYFSHNNLLKYNSTTIKGNVMSEERADETIRHIQMVGENSKVDENNMGIALAQGEVKSLGTVSFTIDAAAKYDEHLAISIIEGTGVGVTNIAVNNNVTAIYPKATNADLGAEVNTTYTVTYADGVEDEAIEVPANQIKEYNNTLTLSSTRPAYEGHTFQNWLGSDGQTYELGATYSGNSDLTLTAQWQKNTVTVTWSGVGTDGSDVTTEVNYGETAVYPGEDPTKTIEGYTVEFLGWNIDENATTALSPEQMKVSVGTTFYPIFSQTINKYTITFKDGATTLATLTQDYGTPITEPTVDGRDGYTLSWDKEVPATMPAGDMEINAVWTKISYVITLDTAGGTLVTGSETIPYDIESDSLSLPEVTREGYAFDGWLVTEAEGSWNVGEKLSASAIAAGEYGNVTLTAQWNADANSITYTHEPNVTVTGLSSSYVTNETDDINIPNPTVEGYTFKGWTSTALNITEAKTDVSIPAGTTGTVDLKGHWTVNSYTITFKDGETTIGTITQNYNTEVKAPADPTKTGYTFAGWDTTIPTTMPAKNMTITAKWNINQYTITFNTDGGSEVKAITQDYNTEVTAPADPTKTGYTFAGWDTTIPTTMPAENITITAKWNINQYTITFNTDGGSEVKAITQDYNTAITAPTAPTKAGYTFAGWDTTIPTTMPAENVTITAKWTINTYKVTYVTGGVALPDNMSNIYEYDILKTVPLPELSKTNWTFAGWKVTESDETTSWAKDAVLKANENGVTGKYGNVTLTAQWEVALTYVVEDYKYAADDYMLLRIADNNIDSSLVYQYDGTAMYYTTEADYLIESTDTGVFFLLVPSADGTIDVDKISTKTADRQRIARDGKINSDDVVNIADANIVYQMIINGGGYYGDQLNIEQRLEADMSTAIVSGSEHRGTIADVNAIINKINGVSAE